MSEPYFPPPPKKEDAPYRAAAEVPIAPPVARRAAPAPVAQKRVPSASATDADAVPERESFLTTFLVRFGIRVGALALVLGISYVLIRAGDDGGGGGGGGAKWPSAVILVLGVVGTLAMPFVAFVRIRRLWRSLFARND